MYIKMPSRYRIQYVGKSKDFFKRSGTHRNAASHMMTDAQLKKCFIAFGLVSCFEKSRMSHDITADQLLALETFLINDAKPIGNDEATKKGYKGNPIIVFNTGNRGFFQKVMSNCPDLVKFMKASFG